MPYLYTKEKEKLFTDEGQRVFLKIRDSIRRLLKTSGAIRVEETLMNASVAGNSWEHLACFDRMVELGEIREISPTNCAGQHRIFVSAE